MPYNSKLHNAREILKKFDLGGFIVPRTDEYLGEYVPPSAERLAWLTGFTGSAGLAIILNDKAVVMSDGRYTIQLRQQVDSTEYEIANTQEMKPEEWLKANAPSGTVIGFDPALMTPKQLKSWQKSGMVLKPCENIIDKIWTDHRPAPPLSKAALFPLYYAGLSAAEKIGLVQKRLKESNADGVLLTMSDSIAWLLNVRGNDIPFIPVLLSYAYVPLDGKVQWFINTDKISSVVSSNLSGFVELNAEHLAEPFLKSLSGKKIEFDPKRSSLKFKYILEQAGVEISFSDDPCLWLKACKNETEQNAMRAAHVRDGVAMVRFLHWYYGQGHNMEMNELFIEEKLESVRAQAGEYREPSFSTIAGFGANGAIVHYRANEKTCVPLKSGNMLLLDSGAQYDDGTTDITRTLSYGVASPKMKEHFTYVLQGHIALASARFAKGTKGKELDMLARAPLQEHGLDYAHGTGHGVGCYLSVHEESASISPRGEEVLLPGMILSNEPGYYKEGDYGIRIENLILTKEDEQGMLYFETLTLCPIDKKLIVKEILSDAELNWLNDYHRRVYETLAPKLEPATQLWLKEATSPL